MRKFAIVAAFFVCFIASSLSWAADQGRQVVMYFFWGDGCPHCHHEKPFLEELKKKYPSLIVKDYEVWQNVPNKELYEKIGAVYGQTKGSVPATFVGLKSWIGYDTSVSEEIADAVGACVKAGCIDPIERVSQVPDMASVRVSADQSPLPTVAGMDVSRMSLPLLTVILAGLDGFNPCAFFVLLSLLSLMVHARSRLKMLLVGGVFIFFSGFIYFLFMAAWLNLFIVAGRVNLITTAAGLVAVVMALINIKDFFIFKQGVSLTISDDARNSLQAAMRRLLLTGSLWAMALGTAALAVMANLYELLCTAGFPMVFTRALTLQHLSQGQYYLYLILYNVIYVLPLLVIVVVFAFTLGSRKLTEEEGRFLKLVSGMMMLGLGGVLMINPKLLNNIFVSLGWMACVIILSISISWLTRHTNKAHLNIQSKKKDHRAG